MVMGSNLWVGWTATPAARPLLALGFTPEVAVFLPLLVSFVVWRHWRQASLFLTGGLFCLLIWVCPFLAGGGAGVLHWEAEEAEGEEAAEEGARKGEGEVRRGGGGGRGRVRRTGHVVPDGVSDIAALALGAQRRRQR